MLASLYRSREQKSGSMESVLREFLGGGSHSKAGVPINWKTALECVTVLACVRVIVEGIAQVPWKLYRALPDGTRGPATDHGLYDLLHRKPNAWQTSFEFREQIGLHLCLARNAYVFKNIVRGRIVELLPLRPDQVRPRQDPDTREIVYDYAPDKGPRQTIPAANIWHLRGLSWDGLEGIDGVRLAREAIGLAVATEDHASRMFSNGARVSGVLTTDAVLKDDQVKTLRQSWNDTYAGLNNAGKTAILWGGLKFSPVALQADQAQMIETRRFQVEQICAAYRVLPIMVGYTDKTSTYASAEQMFLAHVVHTLGPWYERIDQSADVNLLTDADRRAGYYSHFIVAGLLRGAHKDRAEYYAKALGAGGSPAWMTQDEVRGLEELNPKGGDADRLPVPTNTGTQTNSTSSDNANR